MLYVPRAVSTAYVCVRVWRDYQTRGLATFSRIVYFGWNLLGEWCTELANLITVMQTI